MMALKYLSGLFNKSSRRLKMSWDYQLLVHLDEINDHQQIVVSSVDKGWPMEEFKPRIKSLINYEIPRQIKNARPHSSPGLLEHLERRLADFSRLYLTYHPL